MRPLFAFLSALALLGLATGASLSGHAQSTNDTGADAAETEKIRRVIDAYLEENPEIVVQAIQTWQKRQQMARILPKVELYRGTLTAEDAPQMGNPQGDVTVIEFFDYRCGFCRRHFPAVRKLVKEDGNIRFMPKQFPILDQEGSAQMSRMAARAALAAHRQDAFGEYHTALMTRDGSLTEQTLYDVAAELGLDVAQLKDDMGHKLVEKRIQNNLAIGRDIGFSGTPAYIIGDEIIQGAEGYGALKNAVAKARAKNAEDSGR
ncbi:DsbA family protein [Yunchengibacter salinarum]|uniref:DsbA family protein n=1 Tax=Yunchengibacter salinarum TaxID=3133399 RepID=UPI0035B66CAE